MQNSNGRPIKTAITVFDIIENIHKKPGQTLTEIAENCPQTRGTVYQYLNTLDDLGYLVRKNNAYYVSLRFLEIGIAARNEHQLSPYIGGTLQKLADETGEITSIVVPEQGRSYTLALNTGSRGVQAGQKLGLRQHLHCSAAGKCILANFSKEKRNEIIETEGLPEKTESTISTRKELEDEVSAVIKQNIAYMREELIEGLNSVAAPINTKGINGAVSIAGPSERLTGDYLEEELAEKVKAAANSIELEISYS